jgi:hypothetical protein
VNLEAEDIMTKDRTFILLLVLLSSLIMALKCEAADAVTGAWALSTRADPGKIHLTLSQRREHGSFSTSSDWSVADLAGLDLASAGKHDVHFSVARDAGRVDGDGFVSGEDGAGLFTFTPSPRYVADMAALGFGGIDDEKLMSYALHDVSLAFAKEMKAAHIEGLDVEKLLAFRIFKVDSAFLAALKAEGLKTLEAKRLIAFRIHKVTPEFVGAVHKLGFFPTDEQFTAMRIHKVTPEYIQGLVSKGVKNLTVDQLIKLRIHNIA